MRTDTIDLVAVHNLIDTGPNLAVLRDLKGEKKIRYVGVTVWRDNQFDGLEPVMRAEPLDFVQVNYAIDNRAAAERILPLAADKGIAVMVNVPFGRDRLFKAVQGKDLPPVAKEIGCTSWPQFFLKYVLGHRAVTCPIPGMAKASYVEDNLGAAHDPLPDAGSASRWRPSLMRSDILSRRAALALALAATIASPALAEDMTGKIKIGVIGGGNIGGTIGGLWVKDGHEVMFASRHPRTSSPSSTNSGPRRRRGRRRKRSSSRTRCSWRCRTRLTRNCRRRSPPCSRGRWCSMPATPPSGATASSTARRRRTASASPPRSTSPGRSLSGV